MILSWNYTLEMFFWIILGAVILVSLTILLARPSVLSRKSQTSEGMLSLTGEKVHSSEEKILNQNEVSSRVEEEFVILEEIKKREAAWIRFGKWIGNIPIRLVRWIVDIPIRLVRWIGNIPTQLRRLGKWIVDIPGRLVRWIGTILRFLREKWKAIVVGIGLCFYFGLVWVLGALIILETLKVYENIEITGEWGGITLETWVFRLALVFGSSIFLTGLISAYSFFAKNREWSRNSCRTTAIVLLLFIAFGFNVADMDLSADSIVVPLDDTCTIGIECPQIWQWRGWERDLEDAGIVSIYLVFASLLFSGDLKRIWRLLRKKWMAINTYTSIWYLVYLLAFISVFLLLAVLFNLFL